MTARVLVVDDIPANVKLLEARLSAEYFDVITATNGEEALATCERAKCDIVLLDVMMPDMNGFEVCRRLKAGVTTHHIPVVMVTALDQPSDRVKGLEAGADDFPDQTGLRCRADCPRAVPRAPQAHDGRVAHACRDLAGRGHQKP
jgi:two-component system, cell cycle response regulator